MGDLEVDARCEPVGDGRFRAELSDDWAIWGPNGGYVASVALRAAGLHCGLPRPATLTCQFLKPGRFDVPVDVEVVDLRRSKRTAAMRVGLDQGGERFLEAQVWGVTDVPGVEHDHEPPATPGSPFEHLTVQERFAALDEEAKETFRFWENFESRPLRWVDDWEARTPTVPEAGGWYRYLPTATFDDPWVDACRSLILADTFTWPAVVRAHTEQEIQALGVISPSLDLQVQFHHAAGSSEWLQVHGRAAVAQRGTIGFTSRVWSEAGQLTAVGGGTMLCVPVRG